MEREEIRDLALSELVQRSFRLMRENDSEADKAFTERTEITGRMDEYIHKCGAEAKQLYEEYNRSVSDTHSTDVRVLAVLRSAEAQRLVFSPQAVDLLVAQVVQDAAGLGGDVRVGIAEAALDLPLNVAAATGELIADVVLAALDVAAAGCQLSAQGIEAALRLEAQVADRVVHAVEAGHDAVVQGIGAVADALLDAAHAVLQAVEVELGTEVGTGQGAVTAAAEVSEAVAETAVTAEDQGKEQKGPDPVIAPHTVAAAGAAGAVLAERIAHTEIVFCHKKSPFQRFQRVARPAWGAVFCQDTAEN